MDEERDIVLEVPFTYSSNSNVIFCAIEAFTYHVLYTRGCINSPFHLLCKEVEEYYSVEECVRPSSTMRKKRKLVEDINLNMSCIFSSVQLLAIKQFCLVLGPSANNAKEIYVLDFEPSLNAEAETCSFELAGKVANMVRKRVVHKLIEAQSSAVLLPPIRTNAFFTLRTYDDLDQIELRSDAGEKLGSIFECFGFRESLKDLDGLCVSAAEGQCCPAPPAAARKRRDKVVVHMTVRSKSDSETFATAAPVPGSAVPCSAAGRWLVSSRGVKFLHL